MRDEELIAHLVKIILRCESMLNRCLGNGYHAENARRELLLELKRAKEKAKPCGAN